MNYTKKSFSVNAPGSQQYRDNWERTFRHTVKTLRCIYCDGQKGVVAAECSGRKGGHEFRNAEEPKEPREADFPTVMELRRAADRAAENGKQEKAEELHRAAAALFERLTKKAP